MTKQRVECGRCGKKFWSRVILDVAVDVMCRKCTNLIQSKQRQPLNRKLRRLKRHHPKQFEKLMEKRLPKIKRRIEVKTKDGKVVKNE